MTAIPPSVHDYWHRMFSVDTHADHRRPHFAISETLNIKRPAMLLRTVGGATMVVVRPEIARRTGIESPVDLSADDMERLLRRAGVTLHDPDHLFYWPPDTCPSPPQVGTPRLLTDADHAAFARFHDAAPEADREEAWVELDHWAVFGCFDGDRLVSAASMTLWDDGPIADLGVLTLPDARGKGFGRAVIHAINRFARQRGHEPQYRCQFDNRASVALAHSCGLVLFGQWTVAADGFVHPA